jgi:hypothetical protein
MAVQFRNRKRLMLIIIFVLLLAMSAFSYPDNNLYFYDPDIPNNQVIKYKITNEDSPGRNRLLTLTVNRQGNVYHINMETIYDREDLQHRNEVVKGKINANTMMPIQSIREINKKLYYQADYFSNRVKILTDYSVKREEGEIKEEWMDLDDIVLDREIFAIQACGLRYEEMDDHDVMFVVEDADYLAMDFFYHGIEIIGNYVCFKLETEPDIPVGEVYSWYDVLPPHKMIKMEFDLYGVAYDGDVYEIIEDDFLHEKSPSKP